MSAKNKLYKSGWWQKNRGGPIKGGQEATYRSLNKTYTLVKRKTPDCTVAVRSTNYSCCENMVEVSGQKKQFRNAGSRSCHTKEIGTVAVWLVRLFPSSSKRETLT